MQRSQRIPVQVVVAMASALNTRIHALVQQIAQVNAVEMEFVMLRKPVRPVRRIVANAQEVAVSPTTLRGVSIQWFRRASALKTSTVATSHGGFNALGMQTNAEVARVIAARVIRVLVVMTRVSNSVSAQRMTSAAMSSGMRSACKKPRIHVECAPTKGR